MSIQNNTVSLQEVLDKVSSLPEASSGGGMSGVKTCTIKVDVDGNTEAEIIALQYIDGNYNLFEEYSYPVPATINNVVCGSLISASCAQPMAIPAVDGGVTVFLDEESPEYTHYFLAPLNDGAYGIINLFDD